MISGRSQVILVTANTLLADRTAARIVIATLTQVVIDPIS